MPFVATRDGYRKQGNCRTLMRALQALLTKMEVRWLLLPSVPETYGALQSVVAAEGSQRAPPSSRPTAAMPPQRRLLLRSTALRSSALLRRHLPRTIAAAPSSAASVLGWALRFRARHQQREERSRRCVVCACAPGVC